jgi:hypothetical protein
MDKMLMQYVFPEFNSLQGHMRTRVLISNIVRLVNLDIINI